MLERTAQELEEVLGVENAFDLVDLPAVHRVATVPRLDDAREDLIDAGIDFERHDLRPRDHDLTRHGVLELEDAAEHLRMVLCDGPGLLALLDDVLDGQLGEATRVLRLDRWHDLSNHRVEPSQRRRQWREQDVDGSEPFPDQEGGPPGTLAHHRACKCGEDRVGRGDGKHREDRRGNTAGLQKRMGDEYRSESQAEHAPGQEPGLHGRGVSEHAFCDLGVAVVGLQDRLQARFTERVQAGANSCKQRA